MAKEEPTVSGEWWLFCEILELFVIVFSQERYRSVKELSLTMLSSFWGPFRFLEGDK